jgi:hypothetical protein
MADFAKEVLVAGEFSPEAAGFRKGEVIRSIIKKLEEPPRPPSKGDIVWVSPASRRDIANSIYLSRLELLVWRELLTMYEERYPKKRWVFW